MTDEAESAAERIIRLECFTFALACKVGGDKDIREARTLLKARLLKELWAAEGRGCRK